MPEYFFHIGLELLPDNKHSLTEYSPNPVDLTHAFNALRPFLRSTHARSARDPGFDRKSTAPKKTTDKFSDVAATTAREDWAIPSISDDHRIDRIQLECIDMEASSRNENNKHDSHNHIEKGIGSAISGIQTKGRYTPVVQASEGDEWGIVHLYRDAAETPGLYKDSPSLGPDLWNGGNGVAKPQQTKINPPPKDEECTTLCILAVPSYFTPADFLAYVGEETRENVSHFRMIKTSRANRYMVLMKFRNGKRAREWQHEWNGKVFNSMEPETCHVVFLKSVEIMQPPTSSYGNIPSPGHDSTQTFPKMSNDPFAASTPSAKPLAPRTPALVELPTCPVCLERMDETTGLLTILCQHVFHCTCLQKWSGGGCPVCRYTHDDFSTKVRSYKHKSKVHAPEYEVTDEPLECEECHTEENLWQCLICGKVGCGRYGGKHAYKHYEATGHAFSMDLVNKRVWDYPADMYVHRIIQDATKPGEKLVEIPGRRQEATTTALEVDEDLELAKMENVALEYTHLLTSQLESQRVYFEEIVERAVDKASQAGKQADRAISECESARLQLEKLASEHDELANQVLPEAQTQKQRFEKRSSKFEEEAKSAKTKLLEEKSLATSLMERIQHLEDTQIAALKKRNQQLEEENATQALLMEGLQEEHRDAMMQVSAQEKLRAMVESGELEEEDLVGATIQAGPAPKSAQKKVTKVVIRRPPLPEIEENVLRLVPSITAGEHAKFKLGGTWSRERALQIMNSMRPEFTDSMSYNDVRDAYFIRLISFGLVLDKRSPVSPEYSGLIEATWASSDWDKEVAEALRKTNPQSFDDESLHALRKSITELEKAGLLFRLSKARPSENPISLSEFEVESHPLSNMTAEFHDLSAEDATVATSSKPKKKKGKGKKK